MRVAAMLDEAVEARSSEPLESIERRAADETRAEVGDTAWRTYRARLAQRRQGVTRGAKGARRKMARLVDAQNAALEPGAVPDGAVFHLSDNPDALGELEAALDAGSISGGAERESLIVK